MLGDSLTVVMLFMQKEKDVDKLLIEYEGDKIENHDIINIQ